MSQQTITKNFAETFHWYASPGPYILGEFYAFLESPSPAPHSLFPIINTRSESSTLAETLQELIALWMICQEQLKCLRGAEEDFARGASIHGETHCKDQMDELIMDSRNLYCRFRQEMEKNEIWLEDHGEDDEEKEGQYIEDKKDDREVRKWIEKMDCFFEVDDSNPEAESEGWRKRTEEERANGKYWREELLEEWGLVVLRPDEEGLYQDRYVNVQASGGV